MLPTLLSGENVNDVIPLQVLELAKPIRHFIVEDLRSARRFLRKIDREFPIDESIFFELNKRTEGHMIERFLAPCIEGNDIAVISEAGCPGVADPGGSVVALAHDLGIAVKPLVGPNSILLTLMGSGFSGQEFTFHGYLPKERKDRIRLLKQMEMDVHRKGSTHLFMDTPFRNMNVLEDLLNELADHTEICIASNLTLNDENIRTMSANEWRENAYDLNKIPAMFAIGKSLK
jgi:16S rRNA (cytidine1402-2'-O)-methyltransferase